MGKVRTGGCINMERGLGEHRHRRLGAVTQKERGTGGAGCICIKTKQEGGINTKGCPSSACCAFVNAVNTATTCLNANLHGKYTIDAEV